MKRGRNQRRRQGVNPNRALDSNGPEVRIRGTANQIYDKYVALARDASSSGDRVKAENYLQHAEHYFRVIRAMQPAQPTQSQPQANPDDDQPALGGDGREDRRGERSRANGADDGDKPVQEDSVEKSAGDNENDERRSRRRRGRRPARAAQDRGDRDSDNDSSDDSNDDSSDDNAKDESAAAQ